MGQDHLFKYHRRGDIVVCMLRVAEFIYPYHNKYSTLKKLLKYQKILQQMKQHLCNLSRKSKSMRLRCPIGLVSTRFAKHDLPIFRNPDCRKSKIRN